MKEIKNSSQGFTLLELLVVVIIIGILAAIALPQYNKAVWKSRFVQAKTLAKNIANSEEVYFAANGQYTNNFNNLDIDISPNRYNNNKDTAYFDWGECLLVASETRKEVHCAVTKSGNRFLTYILEFHYGTYFINNGGSKRRCIAYGLTDKPTPADMSYKVCLDETGYTTPGTFGGASLSFKYI